MADAHPSADFVRRINAATASAFEELDRRYRQRLCALVERELGKRFAGREDPEDAVQSALCSLYRGVHAKRFCIDHSGALWKLLAQIARRKVLRHVEHHAAAKRSPRREVPAEEQLLTAQEPTPEEAAELADILAQLVSRLAPAEVAILRLRLQGYSKIEIAQEENCTEGTIRYRLQRIRDLLAKIVGEKEER
jgi:RNA polymerase sigma factor (sigma-70 family)